MWEVPLDVLPRSFQIWNYHTRKVSLKILVAECTGLGNGSGFALATLLVKSTDEALMTLPGSSLNDAAEPQLPDGEPVLAGFRK